MPRVVLEPSGWSYDSAAGAPVLAEAARAGIRLPASCRNGTCRACMCRLLEGEVDYAVPWPGLSADEKEAGWILPCVARARTDLRLDAPGAAPREVRALAHGGTGARRC
ncbi:2Fe-2S iron-sulfur cluster-binding protein [Bordetella sp. 2513F-2]